MRAFSSKLKNKVAASPRENGPGKRGSTINFSSPEGRAPSTTSVNGAKDNLSVEDFEAMEKFPKLPALKDVRMENRPTLVLNKLRLCCVITNFNDDTHRNSNKSEVKRHTLLELTEFINSPISNGILQGEILETLIGCIATNIFRALPPKQDNYEPDEDDPVLDPAWPHLQVVYELLLRLVVHPEITAKTAKRPGLMDQHFCTRLIVLFDSEDPRERDYLKTILHRVYGKFMSHRSFLRKSIAHTFLTFVYETRQHNGIGELLEILGSIINGFALPLKEEHVRFLENALLPLHKPKAIASYHPQLAYCVVQFSEKDSYCASRVVNTLVKNWPWSSSTKQLLFLNELEEVLELIQGDEIASLAPGLYQCIAKCVGSLHFQVAERTLFFWHNEILLKTGFLQDSHAAKFLPVIFPKLHESASATHWNTTVAGLCEKVMNVYQDMDVQLYDECLLNYNKSKNNTQKHTEREAKWKAIENN